MTTSSSAFVRSPVVIVMFGLGLLLYLTVSPPLLTVLNIPYDAPTGNFVFKLHPGTYLIVSAFMLAHASRGNPLRSLLQLLREQGALALYFGVTVFLLLYSVLRYGPSGSAFIIETLMMPVIAGLLLVMFDDVTQRRLFMLIYSMIVVNALIAIFESATHIRLVPHTVAGGVALKEDIFRSTALLGHPLNNALITGPLVVLAMGFRLTLFKKVVLLSILILGLLSFGGRTSFLVTSGLMGLYLSITFLRDMIRGRYGYLEILGALITAIAFLAAIIGLVLLTGLGERIFAHLFWDDSANVRVRAWHVFDYMDESDLIFGMSPTTITTIIYRLKLIYPLETIENFYLAMLMQMGLVGFIPFILSLWTMAKMLWRNTGGPGRLAIILFFAIASSNNSLSSKTCALTIFVATALGSRAYVAMLSTRFSGRKGLYALRPFPRALECPHQQSIRVE